MATSTIHSIQHSFESFSYESIGPHDVTPVDLDASALPLCVIHLRLHPPRMAHGAHVVTPTVVLVGPSGRLDSNLDNFV